MCTPLRSVDHGAMKSRFALVAISLAVLGACGSPPAKKTTGGVVVGDVTSTTEKATTTTTHVATVSYANCSQAKAAGAAPLHRGDPGYSSKLDRDGDGTACET